MLVPRTRLILWTAGIVLPFAALGATVPGAFAVSAFFLAAFFLVAVADAVLAPRNFAGVRIELPEIVRLQYRREGVVVLHLHNDSTTARVLRFGLAFPREIVTAGVDRIVRLPGGAAESRFEWFCTPTRRGQYFLREVYLETASQLGFWSARTTRAVHAEVRVYPDLLSERSQAAALFLRRPAQGAHAQRFAGQGREFEKLREFVPGDSLSDIHWKASARRGKPVTKVYQVERSHEVYVVIDASRLSARNVRMPAPRPAGRAASVPAAGETVPQGEAAVADSEADVSETPALERYVTASLLLAMAAERQADQFGLIIFSDRVLDFVRARSGQAHFDACRDRLYTLQPQDVSPDFEEVCTFIRLRLRKRALLIFLTALDDPVLAESFSKAVDLISRQQLVLVNLLQPPGAEPLFSEAAPVAEMDDLYRRLGGHLRWQALRELQKTLQRRGVRLSFLDPAKLSAELIAQHAEISARQLL